MRGVLSADVRNLRSELKGEIVGIRDHVVSPDERLERGIARQAQRSSQFGAVLQSLTGVMELLAGGVFETRIRLPKAEDTEQALRSTTESSPGDVHRQATQSPSGLSIAVPFPDTSALTCEASPFDRRPIISAPAASFTGCRMPALAPLLDAAGEAAEQCISDDNEDNYGAGSNIQLSGLSGTRHVSIPSAFCMESNHSTVVEIWNEWNIGVAGRPSVRAMVEAGLRKSDSQRKLFGPRKIIIDEIETLAKAHAVSELEIVGRLDSHRAANRMSITKLQDAIKKKKATGGNIV